MEAANKYIISQEFLVSSADVDFEERLRFSSLANYLIQVASKHAEKLKWGADDLLKYNAVWVLSGLQIELDEYPLWRDKVTIESWPKGINRLFYMRDYRILNEQGREIGRASSNWLLIDVDRRRPKLIAADNDVFEQNTDKHAIEALLPMLKFDLNMECEMQLAPRFSDIDLNKHLTTTRYIDWVFDMYTPEDVSKDRPKSMVVNFRKEILFGELVVMQRSIQQNKTTNFCLKAQESEQVYFLAQLGY